jgi:hypothetical protein
MLTKFAANEVAGLNDVKCEENSIPIYAIKAGKMKTSCWSYDVIFWIIPDLFSLTMIIVVKNNSFNTERALLLHSKYGVIHHCCQSRDLQKPAWRNQLLLMM